MRNAWVEVGVPLFIMRERFQEGREGIEYDTLLHQAPLIGKAKMTGDSRNSIRMGRLNIRETIANHIASFFGRAAK